MSSQGPKALDSPFLLHEILPDAQVPRLQGMRKFQPASFSFLRAAWTSGSSHRNSRPHQDEQAQVLGLVEGLDDAVRAGRAGAGGHVPGDQVAQGGVEGRYDAVEEGFLLGSGMLALQIPSRGLHLALLALCFHHIAEEGLVPAGAVLHAPELKLKVVGRQSAPYGSRRQTHREGEWVMSSCARTCLE